MIRCCLVLLPGAAYGIINGKANQWQGIRQGESMARHTASKAIGKTINKAINKANIRQIGEHNAR